MRIATNVRLFGDRRALGARVGMLCVGFLEKPFRKARWTMIGAARAAFALALAIKVPFLLRLARAIFRPLERVNGTIAAVDAGDFGARTGEIPCDYKLTGRLPGLNGAHTSST